MSIRARTDSWATIWFTVTCLPDVAEEVEQAPTLASSRGLSTKRAWWGPGEKSSSFSSWTVIASTLRARVSASSRLRSSDAPLGSPIIPVAPPASDDRPVPGDLEAPQHHQAEEVADVEAVGGRVEADVDGDRTVGEARGQRVAIGGVVDEAASVEVGEQVHGRQWWQKAQRA